MRAGDYLVGWERLEGCDRKKKQKKRVREKRVYGTLTRDAGGVWCRRVGEPMGGGAGAGEIQGDGRTPYAVRTGGAGYFILIYFIYSRVQYAQKRMPRHESGRIGKWEAMKVAGGGAGQGQECVHGRP